jgi:hypothetical protein
VAVKNGNRYPPEFRANAIRLYRSSGKSLGAVSSELGRGRCIYMDQAYSGVLRPQASIPAQLDALIHFGLLALIAFLVGFVVRRHGWLAALVAYLIGLAIWVVVDIRPTPPWMPTDVSGIWLAVFWSASTASASPDLPGASAFGGAAPSRPRTWCLKRTTASSSARPL